MENSNNKFEILQDEIFLLSFEKEDWELACKEWELSSIYFEPDGTCLCTKTPITEHCVIVNKITKEKAIVGNHCIANFMPELSEGLGKITGGYKRILSDAENHPNEALIDFAYEKAHINYWEYEFALDVWRKRKTTTNQDDAMIRVNLNIINGFNKSQQPVCPKKKKVYLNRVKKKGATKGKLFFKCGGKCCFKWFKNYRD